MKIKKKASKKTFLLPVSIIIGLISISGIALATLSPSVNKKDSTDSNSEAKSTKVEESSKPASDEEIEAGNITKQESVNNGKNNPIPENGNLNNGSTVGFQITGINKDNNNLVIRTLIEAIDNSGTCRITMTGPGPDYNDSMPTQASANVSTCQGFNVPLTSLSSGKWNITIKYQGATTQGQVNSEVEI